MANLFDFDARSNEAVVGGGSADTAMGTAPRAGLRLPRGAAPPAELTNTPDAYRQALRDTAARVTQPGRKAPTEPLVGYDEATDTIFSGGQKFSASNLTELDEALRAGYLDVDNTGKVPQGMAMVRASGVKNFLQTEGANRGFGSAAKEVGSQVLQGFADIPLMGVRAAQFAAPAGGPTEQAIKGFANEYEASRSGARPDVYGRGEVASALIKGGRSIAPSVAAGAAMFAAPVLGTAAAGATFFGSAATDTYERGLAAGLSPEDAKAAAIKTGAIEAGGELIGDFAGAKLITGAGKGLSMMAKGVQMSQGKRVAVDLLANAGIQSGTEFGQAYGQTAVETGAGIGNEDPFAAGVEGAKVGLGMSALMAPFGAAAGYANRPRNLLPAPTPEAPAEPQPAGPSGPLQLGYEAPAEQLQLGYEVPFVPQRPVNAPMPTMPMGAGPNAESVLQRQQNEQAAAEAQAAYDKAMQDYMPNRTPLETRADNESAAAEAQAAYDRAMSEYQSRNAGTIEGSPSEGSPAAVAPSVTPQEPQTPAEPFSRPALNKKKRTELALKAQDLGIQVTGKMTKAEIVDALEEKITGKAPAKPAPTAPAAPKAAAPTKGPKAPKADAPVLTPEEQELAEAIDDERSSGAGMAATNNALKSAVQSLPGGKPKGRITIGRNIMAGIVRALRKPFNPDAGDVPATPLVYVEGTAKTEKDLTTKYSTQMTAMRDAALKVAKAYDTLSNRGSNVVTTETKIPEEAGTRTLKANSAAKALREAQQQLRDAVEQLIEASGSAANANALVAAFKTRVQSEIANKTLSATKKQVTGAEKGKGKKKDLGAYWSSMDTNLSSAWKLYNDGQLQDTENLISVPTGEKRNAWEIQKQGAEAEPLVKAATDGYRRHNGAEKEFGILGVLAYLQARNNTPYGKLLSGAVARALRNQKKIPKVVFDVAPGEHASYTPATDTIHLSKTASAEVSLHEALHAALQWVVYTQPNNPAVARLRQAVKDVVAYDRNKLKSENAKGAYDIIAGLAKSGTQNDINAAMLELVSYGMTMPDFAAALRGIPSTQDQQFKALGTKLFDMFAKLIQRFLGVSNTVANDVMDSTARLLEAATEGDRAKAFGESKVTKGKKLNAAEGSTLFAAVTSSTPSSNATPPGGTPDVDLTQFAKKMIPNIITEHLFKSMGWESAATKFLEKAGVVADYIKEKSPALTKYISYVNAEFSVPVPMREWFQSFKTDKHTSAIVTDALANKIDSLPSDQVLELIRYLDGEVKEISVGGKVLQDVKELADMVKEHRERYIAGLRTAKAQRFFRDLKFSESMVFAKGTDDVASSALGARKLNELAAQKTNDQMTDDVQTPLDAEGNPVFDGRFKQLFDVDVKGPDGGPLPAGFIHESMWKDPTKLPNGKSIASDGLVWTHAGKGGDRDTQRFTAYQDAAAAVQAGKANTVANALRNTMAILAASHASNNLTDALAGASGDKHMVVFDSEEALKKALGKTVLPNSILNLSDPEAKSNKLQGIYRSRYQWVRIPKSSTGNDAGVYGALAGKLVRSDVWAAVQDMTDRRPLHNISALHDTMRVFKKAKTVYNPGTHLTNIASNMTLAMMHDLPMKTVGQATSMLYRYMSNPDAMKPEERRVMHAFMNSGAMLGDFSSIEVKKALYEAYKDAASTNEPQGVYSKVLGWAKTEVNKRALLAKWAKEAGKTDDRIVGLYSAEDNAFRLAAFLTKSGEIATAKGKTYLTPQEFKEAGDYARFAFLDYDIDSKAVKVMRQSVLPFVSWSYAIMPVLGHIALHKPWKLVNIMLAYTLLDAAMGGDDDEELRKNGPEKFRTRLWGVGPHAYIRIPGLGDEQNPVYYKLGAYVPTGNWFDKQPMGFLGINNWPQPISPGGPFTNIVIGLMGGVDPFTGKPLSAPTDSTWEEVGDRAAFMAKTFTPSWAPTAADMATKAVGGQGKPELGVSGNPANNLLAAQKFLGLHVDSFNTVEAGQIQAIAIRGVKADFDKEVAKIKRAQSRYETPDWEAFYARRDELLQRRDERINEIKGEE